jgi:hypothetical protein
MNGYNLQKYVLGKYSDKRANDSVWNVECIQSNPVIMTSVYVTPSV